MQSRPAASVYSVSLSAYFNSYLTLTQCSKQCNTPGSRRQRRSCTNTMAESHVSSVILTFFFFFLLFFCVPHIYLWGSPFWVRFFAYITVFNPNIEVVTFRLRAWCMLGEFMLPAFTRLGHECRDLWSPCDGMHVCTD